tara:strand:- start:2054 stop:2215 length:162 start_codon:yes stop_codon:yes gene_type:complete
VKIRIINEVGSNNPIDFVRGNTDIKVTIVKSDGTEVTYLDDDREGLAEKRKSK